MIYKLLLPEEGTMRRRDFLKKGTVAVELASSPNLFPPLTASESSPQKPSQLSGQNSGQTGAVQNEIRSADYLRRVQGDEFLPKPPVLAESYRSAALQISPMLLAERVKRKIVPRRGASGRIVAAHWFLNYLSKDYFGFLTS